MKKNALDSVAVLEAYYQAVANKDFEGMERCLHPDVRFLSPIREVKGRDAMMGPAKEFAESVQNVTVRSTAASGDQALMVYDVDFGQPVGKLRAAASATVVDGQIEDLELFFDTAAFS